MTLNSEFRINPLDRNLLCPGLESRSSRASVIGPAEVAAITRKWTAGNIAWLEIRRKEISFSEKFAILWVIDFDGKHFVLLQQEPAVDNDGEACQFILRIIDENTLFTVDAQLLRELIPCFEDSFKIRAPWVAADSAQYFGDLPSFGSPAYKSDKQTSECLRNVELQNE